MTLRQRGVLFSLAPPISSLHRVWTIDQTTSRRVGQALVIRETSSPTRNQALAAVVRLAAVLLFVAIPLGSRADRLVVDMKDGTSNTFDNVIIHSAEFAPGDGLVFNVKPNPEAASYPVELSRVVSIEVGENGQGRAYHLAANRKGGGRNVYENVTVVGYKNGEFRLIPQDSTQVFPLDGTVVIAIQPAGSQGNHAAFGAAPLPDSWKNFQAGNLGYDRQNQPVASTEPVVFDESEEAEPDELDEGPRINSIEDLVQLILTNAENDTRPQWVRRTVTALRAIVSSLSIATLVWCLIGVFMEDRKDKWLIAILLIICCCGWFVKVWYAFARYDLGAKLWLRVLIIAEILMALVVGTLEAMYTPSLF